MRNGPACLPSIGGRLGAPNTRCVPAPWRVFIRPSSGNVALLTHRLHPTVVSPKFQLQRCPLLASPRHSPSLLPLLLSSRLPRHDAGFTR